MNDEKGYIVGGILFEDEKTAKRAEEEAKRIETLNAKLSYENPKSVYTLYQKAHANNVFITPVGINYMLQLQVYLYDNGYTEDDIPPLAVKCEVPAEGTKKAADDQEDIEEETEQLDNGRSEVFKARIDAQKARGAALESLVKKQWIVIIAMAVVIVAMFIISLTGNNPTIINYRSKILNQYSQWEQELNEREAAVSIKEQGANAGAGAGSGASSKVIDKE